jgi:hypothetical protein
MANRGIHHADALAFAAQEGYSAERCEGTAALKACPYGAETTLGMAWLAGAWLRSRGYGAPLRLRSRPGQVLSVDGLLLSFADPASITIATAREQPVRNATR